MKLITSSLLIILLFSFKKSEAQGYWKSAKEIQAQGASSANKIAKDNTGNIYIAGSFKNGLLLGSHNYTSYGKEDIYIVKYSPSGQLLWSKHLGSKGVDDCTGISLDPYDNLYVTGNYSDTFKTENETFPSNGHTDIFIAKYNKDGSLEWIKSQGNQFRDYSYDIVADNFGNFYLTGTISTDSSHLKLINYVFDNKDTLLTKGGMFYAKYKANGDLIWAKMNGSNNYSNSKPSSITLDNNGNFYISGSFADVNEYFDGIKLQSNSIGYVLGTFFIAKYDSSGKAMWANRAGGKNSSSSTGATLNFSITETDSKGNVYVTGDYYNCDMLFDNGFTLNNIGDIDVFIVKYSSTGQLQWAKNAGGNSWDNATSIAVDNDDYVYIAGSYNWNGNSVIGSDTLKSLGKEDLFVAKYNSDGDGIWGISTGGDLNDKTNDIITVGNDVYLAGAFNSQNAKFGSFYLSSGNDQSGFIAVVHIFPVRLESANNTRLEVKTYPNPTSGVLYLNDVPNNSNVFISDLLGRNLLKRENTSSKSLMLDINDLSNGSYLIQIKNKNGEELYNAKILKASL